MSNLWKKIDYYLLKARFKFIYQWLARNTKQADILFMNYGFAMPDSETYPLVLQAEDEHYRYPIQLYHYVASAIDLKGQRVLEIGSGRGGGAYFVKRYLKPRELIAIDISPTAIRNCNCAIQEPGLFYQEGDAENLPFEDNSFDAVINVESSHCYPDQPRFFQEVKRVLRPGGYLLFADLRWINAVEPLRKDVEESGLTLLSYEDITENIVASLDLDHQRKAAVVDRETHYRFMSELISNFVALKDTPIYHSFRKREIMYQRLLLQKPDPSKTSGVPPVS